MAKIIDGKLISEEVLSEIKTKTDELKANKGITPGLALLLVGEDAASKIYVSSKDKACAALGFNSIIERRAADTSEEEIISQIDKWNADDSVHGILVQLPLPKHINEDRVLLRISPKKDVDGFHPENAGRLMIGMPGFVPCTPAGIVEMIKRMNIDINGKHVVVVGRSNIVGKPIANLLYQKNKYANAVVTICHTGAPDLKYYTRQADVLVAAVGVPELIKAEDVKDGVVIIDVGINRVEDATLPKGYRVCGDVDFEGVSTKASYITPVPGGVGKMTIAMLMYNTFKSAEGTMFDA